MDLGDFSRFGAMRTRRLDRRTCALCALAAMVALLATRFSGRETDVTDLPPRAPGAALLLFGRSIGHGGRIEFERAHRGALPRLVIISGRTFDESTITDAMALVLAALALMGLSIFGPGIATGLVSGAPQLGAPHSR